VFQKCLSKSNLNHRQRKLFSRSDRVKGTDFHPTEPWLLTGLYNGSVNIYNHETLAGALVKTFEVSNVPVPCVKFISRKNWFVRGRVGRLSAVRIQLQHA
jgi:WD40 repeat protein